MEDSLTMINRLIEQHQAIRGHLKLVGDSISDAEAVASLEATQDDWIPGRPGILAEKQKKLQQMLRSLDEGLKNHFAFEEEALPPLLGELFMRALILDHQQINKEIDEARSTVAATGLEGLNREESLSRESYVQQVANSLCDLVGEHATREETILGMLQRALTEKG